MRKGVTAAFFGAVFLLAVGAAQGDSAVPRAAPHDPPLTILINPEARVSVGLGGALPAPAHCGRPIKLPIRIINQGFVTARLEAKLVDNMPPGVMLHFYPAAPLKGVPEELRVLQITLMRPGLVDLTIAFHAHNDTSDLGGSGRIHFLIRCLAPSGNSKRAR